MCRKEVGRTLNKLYLLPAKKRREKKRTLFPSIIIHFQMKSKMVAALNLQRGGLLTLSLVSCKGSGEKGWEGGLGDSLYGVSNDRVEWATPPGSRESCNPEHIWGRGRQALIGNKWCSQGGRQAHMNCRDLCFLRMLLLNSGQGLELKCREKRLARGDGPFFWSQCSLPWKHRHLGRDEPKTLDVKLTSPSTWPVSPAPSPCNFTVMQIWCCLPLCVISF